MQWSDIRFLGNSKLVQQNYIWIFIVPIMSKLIKSTDSSLRIFGQNFKLELPFSWHLLYFSAFFFAFGHFIYLIFCPKVIKKFTDYGDFKQSGFIFENLNSFLNELSIDCMDRGKRLTDKITEYSAATQTTDIDNDNTTLVEINNLDKAYNIKNVYEDNIFWLIHEFANNSRNIKLTLSFTLFFIGGLLLGFIIIKNLLFVLNSLL